MGVDSRALYLRLSLLPHRVSRLETLCDSYGDHFGTGTCQGRTTSWCARLEGRYSYNPVDYLSTRLRFNTRLPVLQKLGFHSANVV